MKKFLLTLAVGLSMIPLARSATVTVSNYSNLGLGFYGIVGNDNELIGDSEGLGVMGRMTISDNEITALLEENDIEALIAAFQVFNPTTGTFTLNSLQDGAFQAAVTASTLPSPQNEFGGSPIFVWLFKGSNNRLDATDFLLAKLNATFPTDSETPSAPLEVFLRTDTATFFAGSWSAENTHDFGLESEVGLNDGDGPLPVLKMDEQIVIPPNTAPVAVDGALALITGQSAQGTLVATDADEEDTLTFSILTQPTKGDLDFDAEDGSYTYLATEGQLGADSFTFQVNDGTDDSNVATVSITISDVPGSEAPVIAVSEPPSGYVGTYYEYEIQIDNLPQGEPTAYAARGLPSGLRLNTKTGIISGYPSRDYITGKEVILTAKNKQGTSPAVTVLIIINPVPEAVVGTFLARVDRHLDIADGLGGCLNLTTTSKGAYSAKLKVGAISYTGRGKLEISDGEDDPVVAVTITFASRGKPTLVADLLLDIDSPSLTAFQLTGSLTDAVAEASVGVSGVRNVWTKTSLPEDYMGSYTFGLSIPESLELNPDYPQGYGFGALTITNKGVGSFVGKTADDKKFTVSSIVGPQGHLPFFCALPSNTGSLVSIPQVAVPEEPLDENPYSLTGAMSWSKPAKAKERAYGDGFEENINLTLFGGIYVGAPEGGVVAGLPDNGPTDSQANVNVAFYEGGLEDDISLDFTIMNKRDRTTQTVIVPRFSTKITPNPNPNTIAFRLISRPAGYFSGTFIVPNEDRKLVRRATYQGTFISKADGSFDRLGYFLLAELPDEDGEKVTTTPLLSGWVDVTPVPPIED